MACGAPTEEKKADAEVQKICDEVCLLFCVIAGLLSETKFLSHVHWKFPVWYNLWGGTPD